MTGFTSLNGMEGRLYRGISHPVAVSLARSVGVGPFRQIAIAALKQDVPDEAACEFLASSLKKILERQRQLVGYVPQAWGKAEQLRALLGIVGGIGVGSLEMADHVTYDYDALLTPDVGRSTDSVTLSPRVAVLYAYGIRTDDFFEKAGQVKFFSGTPTSNPHVALLSAGAKAHEVDGPAFDRLKLWYEKRDEPGVHTTVEEVKTRVGRDHERLLREVCTVEDVIPLPSFDVNNPTKSLDDAAAALRAAKAAV